MISLAGIDHLVLRVVDLDTMLRFYLDVLGCTVERRQDNIGLVQLRAGSSLIDLVPVTGTLGQAGGAAPGPEGRNLDHFCLRVEPFDEAAIRAHLGRFDVKAGPVESRMAPKAWGPPSTWPTPRAIPWNSKGHLPENWQKWPIELIFDQHCHISQRTAP